jgi:hypothetical protein
MKKPKEMKPGTHLIVYLVGQLGLKDAIKVASFIVAWGAVARSLGRQPTKEEYTVHWKESQATYYRELARFKKVWPEDVDPDRVWNWVESNVAIPVGKNLDDRAVLALLLAPARP